MEGPRAWLPGGPQYCSRVQDAGLSGTDGSGISKSHMETLKGGDLEAVPCPCLGGPPTKDRIVRGAVETWICPFLYGSLWGGPADLIPQALEPPAVQDGEAQGHSLPCTPSALSLSG